MAYKGERRRELGGGGMGDEVIGGMAWHTCSRAAVAEWKGSAG